MSQLEILINRFLDDRSELAPAELDELIAGLRAEPDRAVQLREQLVVDDLLAQKMTVDRRNFMAQVQQRIADFERTEDEIDNQVSELRELATAQFERPSRWSGNSTWVRAALALSLAAALAGFFLLPRWRTSERRPVARVVAVQGTVTATENQATAALVQSETLFSGQGIAAPVGSSLTIEYDDRTQIRIAGGSQLTLDIEQQTGAKRMTIDSGEIWATVAKQTVGAMEFATPHAVAVVLGTQLHITVTADDTLLEVTEGQVRLDRLAQRDSIDVAANQSGLASETLLQLRPLVWPASTEGLAYAFDPFVRRVPRARNPNTRNWYSSELDRVGSTAVNEFTDALELTGGYFHSQDDGHDIVTVSQGSDGFSLELVFSSAQGDSADPARIVGLAGEDGKDNFYLSQAGDELTFVLRTDGPPPPPMKFQLPSVLGPNKAVHLAITYGSGQITAYHEGQALPTTLALEGSLAAWTSGKLLIGADRGGASPWRGTIEAMAIYHRCLGASELARNVNNYKALARVEP
ncbi:MAG: FecR domain-containing protein [Planctomycetaceae bacterium]|nr:FecR domain-containing protein [Planctomycetaceae bacterium]